MAAAAIVLALVAGIGVYMYASGADKRAQENASFVSAYVANADIAKGTTGPELVQAGLITQEKVAKGSVPPGIITDVNALADLMTAGPISTKQFITSGSFVSAKDGGGGVFSNSIAADDLVAVTVTVDADHGVANQITPGDAKSEGLMVYRKLILHGCDAPRIRFVTFSWPSSKVGGTYSMSLGARSIRVAALTISDCRRNAEFCGTPPPNPRSWWRRRYERPGRTRRACPVPPQPPRPPKAR